MLGSEAAIAGPSLLDGAAAAAAELMHWIHLPVDDWGHSGAARRPRAAPGWASGHQHGEICQAVVLLNPFCPLTAAKVLALKATVLLLLTLLIKARVQIAAGSALGIALLLLQVLVFLAVSGALVVAAGGAAFYATQQRRSAVA